MLKKKQGPSKPAAINFNTLLKERLKQNKADEKTFYEGLNLGREVRIDSVVNYLHKHHHLSAEFCVAGAWLFLHNASIDTATFTDRANNACKWIKMCINAITNGGKTEEENGMAVLHTFFGEIIWSSGYPASPNMISILLTNFFGGTLSSEWYIKMLNSGILDYICRWMVESESFDVGCIKKILSFMATQEFIRDTDFYNHLIKSIDRTIAKTAQHTLTQQTIIPFINSLLLWVGRDGTVTESCPHNLRFASVQGGRTVIQAWSEALARIDINALANERDGINGLAFSIFTKTIYSEVVEIGDWIENPVLINAGLDRLYHLLMANPLYRHFYPQDNASEMFRVGIEPWNNLLRLQIKRKIMMNAIRTVDIDIWNSFSPSSVETINRLGLPTVRELAIMNIKKIWYDSDCQEEISNNAPEGTLVEEPFGDVIDAWECQIEIVERARGWMALSLPKEGESSRKPNMNKKNKAPMTIPQLPSAPKPGATLQVYQDSPEPTPHPPAPSWSYVPPATEGGEGDDYLDFEEERKHLQTSCTHQ